MKFFIKCAVNASIDFRFSNSGSPRNSWPHSDKGEYSTNSRLVWDAFIRAITPLLSVTVVVRVTWISRRLVAVRAIWIRSESVMGIKFEFPYIFKRFRLEKSTASPRDWRSSGFWSTWLAVLFICDSLRSTASSSSDSMPFPRRFRPQTYDQSRALPCLSTVHGKVTYCNASQLRRMLKIRSLVSAP